MPIKILGGIVAMVLAVGYVVQPLIKLKDWALGVVIVLGIIMMLIDLWESLQSKED